MKTGASSPNPLPIANGGTNATSASVALTNLANPVAADDGKALIYNHSNGRIELTTLTSSDLVNDTSPQLGGMLDVNGFSIGDGSLELLKFVETALAVNEVTITNAAAGNMPTISASGDDTNVTLKLAGKGSGGVLIQGSSSLVADTNSNELITFTVTSSAVNNVDIKNNIHSSNPRVSSAGDSPNTALELAGKGARGVYPVNALWKTAVALSDGATPALDASLGNKFRLAAAGDRTIAVPTNAPSGATQGIIIEHFASGAARTLSLNTGTGGFRYGSTITGLTQTTSGCTDYIGALYNSTDNKWDVVAYDKGHV